MKPRRDTNMFAAGCVLVTALAGAAIAADANSAGAPAPASAPAATAATAPASPATLTPAPAPTAAMQAAGTGPGNSLQVVWQVYLAGIDLGTVGLKTTFTADSYSAVSRLKTAGVVNSFYEAVIDASAMGTVAGTTLKPQSYEAKYNGEKSHQHTVLSYASAGVQLIADPIYNTQRFPVTEEQKRDTLDPVSGMVFAMSGISLSPEHPCGDVVKVFDGARRYDIEFTFVKNDTLSSDGYKGPAIKCQVSYKQIAGFKPNLKQGNNFPAIYVWGATFDTQTPGAVKRFAVPVQLMTETPFGTAIAHARKITVDGEVKGG